MGLFCNSLPRVESRPNCAEGRVLGAEPPAHTAVTLGGVLIICSQDSRVPTVARQMEVCPTHDLDQISGSGSPECFRISVTAFPPPRRVCVSGCHWLVMGICPRARPPSFEPWPHHILHVKSWEIYLSLCALVSPFARK